MSYDRKYLVTLPIGIEIKRSRPSWIQSLFQAMKEWLTREEADTERGKS